MLSLRIILFQILKCLMEKERGEVRCLGISPDILSKEFFYFIPNSMSSFAILTIVSISDYSLEILVPPCLLAKFTNEKLLNVTELTMTDKNLLSGSWFRARRWVFTFGTRRLQVVSSQGTPAHREDVSGVETAPVVKGSSPSIKSNKHL